jgi:hypothetical protein
LADHTSTYSYLNVHSFQPIKLSSASAKALAVTLLILQASLPLEAMQNQTFFYWHLLKKASCAKLCAIL